ncbi:hypothetical protein EX30DRAFT_374945 [Ascodesmis nigricans]|uniref:Uncharacterized protein n=1 Tax=Ascodesmis nigricans TaxID=341454 RepID=A0A4S2MJK2_9PEZI|nr:hypothetical protein EX30DRAFT_374945 [Ascodesmis nigricans]
MVAHKRKHSTRVWCPNRRGWIWSQTRLEDRVEFYLTQFGISAPTIENDKLVWDIPSERDWYDELLGELLRIPGVSKTYNWRVPPHIAFGPDFPRPPPTPRPENGKKRRVWARRRNRKPRVPNSLPCRSPSRAPSDHSVTPEVIVIKDEEDTATAAVEGVAEGGAADHNGHDADEDSGQNSQASTESGSSPVKKAPKMSKRARKLVAKKLRKKTEEKSRKKVAQGAEIEARKTAKREEKQEKQEKRRATRLARKLEAQEAAAAAAAGKKKASKRGADEMNMEAKGGKRRSVM